MLALKEGLRSGTEFWDGSKTLKLLSESEYFVDESNKDLGVQWPPALKQMISESEFSENATCYHLNNVNIDCLK